MSASAGTFSATARRPRSGLADRAAPAGPAAPADRDAPAVNAGGQLADAELVTHLTRSTGLPPAVAARVVADVLAYFAETAGEYVRRRHGELQRRGWSNDEIFPQIAAELASRRVAAPSLSLRQLRRLVYG